jgi:protein ImuA
VRNDVPGGAEGLLVPLAGVEKAGGARARVLIEHLRAQIRALEQVPVSLATPAPGAAPPRPACSLPYRALGTPHPPTAQGGGSLPLPQGERGCCGAAVSPIPSPLVGEGGQPLGGRPGEGAKEALPLSRLKRGGLHEIRPEAYRDGPAALSFALAAIAAEVAEQVERRDLVLWCLTKNAAREWGRPYGPGLLAFGLDPALVLIVEARDAETAAWALEEGLKSRALIAALAEIEIKTPLIARRLSLAAQASRTPCLLLSGHRQSGLPGTLTSWRIAAMKSRSAPFDATAPGAPSWQLTLERCRGSAPGRSFIVEFSHESFRFRLSAESSDRAAEAGESSERRRTFNR